MRTFITAIVAVLLLIAVSCAGGSKNAIEPDLTTNGQSVDNGQSNSQIWGLWHCYMEPGSRQIETVPMRTAAFTANINNLLYKNPGSFSVSDLDVSNFQTEGRLDCTVKIAHPFPGHDRFNGFDVRGAFLHNGESMLGYDGLTYGGGPYAGENEAVLLNADGYTRWFNQPEFDGDGIPLFEYWPGTPSSLPAPTAMLNGYKIFANGLDLEDDYYEWITTSGNADNRGWFTAGALNSRRYEFQFPMIDDSPKLDFQFAVIATWDEGDPSLTGDPVLYDPDDFPVSANCDEAFFVNISTTGSDLYYENVSTYGGDFVADIEVFDWQGGSVGNLGVPNEIESIIIEGDFIPTGSHQFSQIELTAIAVPGTENSSVFQVEIIGCIPQASGDTDLWVIVESSGLNGDSYDQGFPTEYPESARRAAFLPGVVTVIDESPVPPPDPIWSQLQNHPSHTGDIGDETGLYPPFELTWSVSFDKTASPAWIEGTPIVGDGKILVFYMSGSTNWAECRSLEDGAWLWNFELTPGGCSSIMSTVTGCYADGKFFVPGDVIRALDPETGTQLWEHPGISSTENPRHGLTYDNGRIIAHLGNRMFVIDAETGAEIANHSAYSGYANFQPPSVVDNIAYYQASSRLRAIDLSSGSQLWSFTVDPSNDTSIRGTPTVPGDGKVYFGCYNFHYYALNQATGAEEWDILMSGGTQRTFDTSAYYDGKIYYTECQGSTIPRIVCLDADDGSEIWGYHDPAATSAYNWSWSYCSPIVADGVVYACCYHGEFYGFDAENGDVLWSYASTGYAQSDPVIVDGKLLFMSSDSKLWCFENAD